MDSFCKSAFTCLHMFDKECIEIESCEECSYYLNCDSCSNLFVCDLSSFFGLDPESADLKSED